MNSPTDHTHDHTHEDKPRRPPRVAFMRNIYLFLHYFPLCLYFFVPNSHFFNSFHSQQPYFFCLAMVGLMTYLRFYALSCQGAGYQTKEPENTEGLFYAEAAGMHCQVRASYCKICKKIVLRRDHHCPWTGHCIGRDNNLYFLMFTLTESFVMTFIVLDLLHALYLNFILFFPILSIAINIIVLGLSLFSLGFTFRMTIQTLTTISKNITIWENKCRDRISYLANYPEWISPFDKGIIENFKEFFTMKEKKMEWKLPGMANLDLFSIPNDVSRNLDEIQRLAEKYHHHH